MKPQPRSVRLSDRPGGGRVLALVLLVVGCAWSWLLAEMLQRQIVLLQGDATVSPSDLAAFWTAGRMAIEGKGAAVYDPAAFAAVQVFAVPLKGASFPWLYPPPAILPMAPWGIFPFGVTLVLHALISTVALGAALAPHCRRHASLAVLTVFSTPMLLALCTGQLTPLLAALLLGALALIARGRDLPAGVLIGVFGLKVHLGAALLPALVGGRHWRVLAAAAATAAVLAVTATVLWGPGIWAQWLAQVDRFSRGIGNMNLSTWFSVFLWAGMPRGAALAAHLPIALAVAALVWAVWARACLPLALRGAVLFCALPLIPPYGWYYSSIFPMIGLVLLAVERGRRADRVAFAALWASGFIAVSVPTGVPMGVVYAPLWSLALVYAAWAALGPQAARNTKPSTASAIID